MTARLLAALAVLTACIGLAGCGHDDRAPTGAEPRDLTLALDFTPNPVQAPVSTTVSEGHDRRRGIRLRIREVGIVRRRPDVGKAFVFGLGPS